MIETVAAAIKEQVNEDGLKRENVERNLIRLLEEEGFDSIVQAVWDGSLIMYAVAFLESAREDILEEVLQGG